MRLKSSIYPEHFGLTADLPSVRKMPGRVPLPTWRGWSSSHKAIGRAFFETTLERDLLILLSADPNIVKFKVQPHALAYWSDEARPTKRSYVPDVVALDVSGQIVVLDAKATIYASHEKWLSKERAIRRAYEKDHGASFVVMTERQIRQQPRLSNCQIMLTHRVPADLTGLTVVRGVIDQEVGGEVDIAAVSRAASSYGVEQARAFSVVMQMALAGELKLDHSAPLSLATKVAYA